MIPLQSATSQTGNWVADSEGGRRGRPPGVTGEGGELGAGGGELAGKEQRAARGPPLGVLRELKEGLGIKNFRQFTKAATVKIDQSSPEIICFFQPKAAEEAGRFTVSHFLHLRNHFTSAQQFLPLSTFTPSTKHP